MDRPRRHPARRAFTLIEITVVLVIIVVIAAAAVPAIRALTGTRSTEAAVNKISAFAGRARLRAIGLQEKSGVFFYVDPQTTLITMGMVRVTAPDPTDPTTGSSVPQYYLDFVPEQGTETLPRGVGVQFFANLNANSTAGTASAYHGFDNGPGTTVVVPCGGVILFDESGRIITVSYGFRCKVTYPAAANTEMGQVIYYGPPGQNVWVPTDPNNNNLPLTSQFGFILYEAEAFGAQFPNPTGATAEWTWLDSNASPYLMNRYNGTLIKGE